MCKGVSPVPITPISSTNAYMHWSKQMHDFLESEWIDPSTYKCPALAASSEVGHHNNVVMYPHEVDNRQQTTPFTFSLSASLISF